MSRNELFRLLRDQLCVTTKIFSLKLFAAVLRKSQIYIKLQEKQPVEKNSLMMVTEMGYVREQTP